MKTKGIFVIAALAVILNVGVYVALMFLKDSGSMASLLIWWPIVSLVLFFLIILFNEFKGSDKVYFLDRDLVKYVEGEEAHKCTLTRKEIKYLLKRQLLTEYTMYEFIDEFNNNRPEGRIYIEK